MSTTFSPDDRFRKHLIDSQGMIKLGVPTGDGMVRHTYGNTWMRNRGKSLDRIVVAPARDPIAVMLTLAKTMPPPFALLYILIYSRQGLHRPGRYQSRQTDRLSDIEDFCFKFRQYLESDGRHQLWICSGDNTSRMAYDNHGLIYAYGDLVAIEAKLRESSLEEGLCAVPTNHVHCLHPKNDYSEEKVMKRSWMYFPLQPMDIEDDNINDPSAPHPG